MGFFDNLRKQTDTNHALQNNPGQFKNGSNSNATVLNTDADNGRTVLNDDIDNGPIADYSDIKLCGEYTFKEDMNTGSGEADILLCEKDGKTYVAKVYHRQAAIKESVSQKIKSIESPYIGRTYATGEFEGYPVEILEYYKNGSLDGKTFDADTLKKMVIPSLNEGLHVLHSNGIIHKDLKPSNIMLTDDRKSVAIIDFGISSVRDDGSTVIVTKTGLTPEYSAPETFRNLFLSESDYYSLGITLYELYAGHTPYQGVERETLEQMISLQKLPFPEDMDEDLKNLIVGLTYQDITNRRDKSNPDRRWGYEEVNNWLKGINQPIPGANNAHQEAFRPIEFAGKKYTDFESLIDAMNKNWEDGKKLMFRDTLARHFSRINPDISDIIWDAQDSLGSDTDEDIVFFETLHKIHPESRAIRWKGKKFNDISDFGRVYLNALRKNDSSFIPYVDEVFGKEILTRYMKAIGEGSKEKLEAISSAESKYRNLKGSEKEKLRAAYKIAYLLSGDKTYSCDGQTIKSIDELMNYAESKIDISKEEFEKFAKHIIPESMELEPQFEAWLCAIGKESEIEMWKNNDSLT